MLEIQRYLRDEENSLESLSKKPYNLSISESEKLVGFKYSQIDSDMSKDICQEARGLILDKRDWSVVSYPFKKFFNAAEGHAVSLDWDSVKLYEKMDGTCCPMYYFEGAWHVHTLGTLFAEGPVGGENEMTKEFHGDTFADLFWETWYEIHDGQSKLEKLDEDMVYTFELITPFNRVVKDYGERKLTLIGVRNRETLEEEWVEEYEDMFDIPDIVDASDLDVGTVRSMIENELDPLDEGFVIVDKDFNRIKIKSESYVFAHRARGNVIDRKHGFVEQIVLGNDDDIIGIYPEYEDAFKRLKRKIQYVENDMEAYWKGIGGPNTDPNDAEERKRFAIKAQQYRRKGLIGLFFKRLTGEIETFKEGLKNMNYRKLGDVLSNVSDSHMKV